MPNPAPADPVKGLPGLLDLSKKEVRLSAEIVGPAQLELG